jgi:catechol 2,3-dioxygenase
MTYRLPESTRLGTVTLQVADLARSIEYYEQVLGMRVIARAEGSAQLGPQGNDTVLLSLRELPGATPVSRRGRLGLYHFALLLPNREALGRFIQHLADLGLRAGMSDHLVSEAVYHSDPDGLGIEVYRDRPRSEWQYKDGQLAMGTDPLDAVEVVRSAGGEPWTGMPPGTTMGHVHLFVGDLEQASAFYHKGLGFDRTAWNYPGALFLSAGGYHHHLGVNTWAVGAEPARKGDARLLEWEVLVPRGADVEQAASSIERAGAAIVRQHGTATAADPWGTRVRVRSEM